MILLHITVVNNILNNHTLEEFEALRKRDIEKTKLVVEQYKLKIIRLVIGSGIKVGYEHLIYADTSITWFVDIYSWLTPEVKLQ